MKYSKYPGVSISKFSRRGRLAARPQNKFLSTYLCGRVAATPNKTLTPIVGSLLYVTPNNPLITTQKPQNNVG